jgi:transposase
MTYCGIDLASKTSAVCVLDATGKILREQMGPTDPTGFSQSRQGGGRRRCVVEAAPLAAWVAQLLEELGHEVVVSDPRRAKAVIQTKNKTDKLDAQHVAKLARTGWYTAVHRKTEAVGQTVNRQAQQDAVCQRLMPVPEVGPLVASTYVATIADPTRFATSTPVPA